MMDSEADERDELEIADCREIVVDPVFNTTDADSSTPQRLVIDHLLGLYDVRWKVPTASVPSPTYDSRLIAPTPANILPPHKRFRDSYSSEDNREEHIEVGTADAKAIADVGINDRVVAHTEDSVDPIGIGDSSESSRKGILDLEDTIYDIVHYMSEVRIDRITEIETTQRQLEASQLVASEERASLVDRIRSLRLEYLKNTCDYHWPGIVPMKQSNNSLTEVGKNVLAPLRSIEDQTDGTYNPLFKWPNVMWKGFLRMWEELITTVATMRRKEKIILMEPLPLYVTSVKLHHYMGIALFDVGCVQEWGVGLKPRGNAYVLGGARGKLTRFQCLSQREAVRRIIRPTINIDLNAIELGEFSTVTLSLVMEIFFGLATSCVRSFGDEVRLGAIPFGDEVLVLCLCKVIEDFRKSHLFPKVSPEDLLDLPPSFATNQKELNMRQHRWLELLSDYDCEIHYHSVKVNVVADALSRKERNKPLRVRALVLTIGLNLPVQILNAQVKARKEENFGTEDLGGMIKTLEPRADGMLCLRNRS
ncbi:hypothetical protein Tco_0485340 [Tanacetum coccineum]